jgi:hypothetical protein
MRKEKKNSKGKVISCPKLEDRETHLRTLSRVHVGIISTKAVLRRNAISFLHPIVAPTRVSSCSLEVTTGEVSMLHVASKCAPSVTAFESLQY